MNCLWLLVVVIEGGKIEASLGCTHKYCRCCIPGIAFERPEDLPLRSYREQPGIAVNGLCECLSLRIIRYPATIENHASADHRGEKPALAFHNAPRPLVSLFAEHDVVGIGEIEVLVGPPSVRERVEHVLRGL